jgi:hypothetical protein
VIFFLWIFPQLKHSQKTSYCPCSSQQTNNYVQQAVIMMQLQAISISIYIIYLLSDVVLISYGTIAFGQNLFPVVKPLLEEPRSSST